MDTIRERLLEEIRQERQRQIERFGTQTGHSLTFWSTILSEEGFEVIEAFGKTLAQAMRLTLTSTQGYRPKAVIDRLLLELKVELIQVASVCVAWAENIEKHTSNSPYALSGLQLDHEEQKTSVENKDVVG